MTGLPLKLAMVVTVGSLLHSIPAATQVSPTTIKPRASGSRKGQRLSGLTPILRLSGGPATTREARPNISVLCGMVRTLRN